ncbi:MAG: sugar ABC transporter substrate-binding protein [Hyphomicrobiales bacterium]|nr:sugar ABC transporter substrate-binding protein [Hyphomicrobiales bacterium]
MNYCKALVAAAAAVIVAVPAMAEELTIGFSWNSKTQPLEQAWEDYMMSEAKKQGEAAGVEINWIFNVADGDPSRQASNIEDLITQGVDIVAARAEDAGAINASIRAAKAAGVPFITFDRKSDSVAPTAHVGGDSYDQALTTGVAFADLLAEKGIEGKCIELQGALTDINAVNRSKGWAEIDAARDEISTLTQVPTEWNPELFRSGMANALRANPDANCAFIASDFAITAVQAALEEAGRWAPTGEDGHFWLATQDLLPGAVPLMEGGYIDVSTSYDAFAHSQEMVRVAIAIHKGEDPACSEDGCLAKGRVVTPATLPTTENLWSTTYK